MVLAMGAGEANRAIATARQILKKEPDNVLALMFVALDSFQRQDYAGAQASLDKMPDGSMAEFIRPLLVSWAQAGQDKFDDTALAGSNPLYPYHALLISDYLNKVENVDAQLARVMQNPSTDVYELEKIGDMLARHDMKDKALTIYKALLAAQPENEDVQDKLKRIENGKDLPERTVSKRIISPEQGAAEAMFDMARLLFREYSDDSALVF